MGMNGPGGAASHPWIRIAPCGLHRRASPTTVMARKRGAAAADVRYRALGPAWTGRYGICAPGNSAQQNEPRSPMRRPLFCGLAACCAARLARSARCWRKRLDVETPTVSCGAKRQRTTQANNASAGRLAARSHATAVSVRRAFTLQGTPMMRPARGRPARDAARCDDRDIAQARSQQRLAMRRNGWGCRSGAAAAP
jgi:hypothetical protein